MTIRLEKVTKLFPGVERPAVDGLDLTIEKGRVCVLLGPSGCGKTTTMKMINRLIPPTSGRIFVDGRDTTGVDEVSCGARSATSSSRSACFPT
jgi:osmoprotectant transport system ATP-binding protein